MDDENLFDEDEALDFIIYDEIQKEESSPKSSGCLSIIILIATPIVLFTYKAYIAVTT
ncbi:hypothetical protein DGMP_26040 [Desulfomarina profundi]|uniref:Uncharacterized protein n=1 Tax=Desulfomarina profundi TaxID=2772557 RepID=A0A8D5JSA8_9BACT|nr:hypothetical protein [Desulfomarina profundi]BCL61911.1 hypothetical protein DGMP_26040 [Desulfomarina profundi]